ncbi:DUF3011 domain-containing protein [Rhizobium puerariae]|uniref:DUF3011 domain-containing protein n=1 Tax=Rhizobium puerariae TaxID=1585791 RepID=A0ABV6ADC7_9HYPH
MSRYFSIAIVALALGILGAPWIATDARAQSTVECQSRNYQYDECWAGPLSRPQLIHQTSGAACILNRTWGYNPRSKYIWVAQGCAGVFADVGGYHHGRGDGFDPDARMYDHHGHDVGAVIGGAVLGALIEGMTEDHHEKHSHSTSNNRYEKGYNGCHGIGCQVDNPDQAIDNRPQFDRQGNPNFDVHGNYQGCHGMGCLVDDPDAGK